MAYIGDFINHGKSLKTSGTSIIILLSLLEDVDSIDVFCPQVNEDIEEFEIPPKVKLQEFYTYDDSISILRLLKIKWKNYDTVIFNMLPTGFGNGTLANAIALFVPILLVKFFRRKNIKIIYHNSVFTNDVRKLGYNSTFDKIRSFFLRIVERILFKNVATFVLLNLYKKRIDDAIGYNKVHFLNWKYLETVPTLYLNEIINFHDIKTQDSNIPTILMHGSWGPQKNIELGLMVLKKLKDEGEEFKLVISGGINHHFPDYEIKFKEILRSYSGLIDEYLGPITEREITKIFLEASLLILPYNAPGGLSGVLEQAIFFEVPTIAIDFPEFREQAAGVGFVRLANSVSDIEDYVREFLMNWDAYNARQRRINISKKITQATDNIRVLLRND
ncbi:glycosyltransferase [Thermogymnomonas acidicola]|uniref:glycosyltransferase n=1 Tax=Thermogymnomonas acidicola TaxID=399579 RepID=UPI001E5E4D4D|nr:glycosyltransferase [Thermogymnomonas acidicola]